MNQKERRAAEKLADQITSSGSPCPSCNSAYGLIAIRNKLQLKCDSCNLVVTIYAQEPSERVFDKQRNTERKVLPEGPPTESRPMKRKLLPFLQEIEKRTKGRR